MPPRSYFFRDFAGPEHAPRTSTGVRICAVMYTQALYVPRGREREGRPAARRETFRVPRKSVFSTQTYYGGKPSCFHSSSRAEQQQQQQQCTRRGESRAQSRIPHYIDSIVLHSKPISSLDWWVHLRVPARSLSPYYILQLLKSSSGDPTLLSAGRKPDQRGWQFTEGHVVPIHGVHCYCCCCCLYCCASTFARCLSAYTLQQQH